MNWTYWNEWRTSDAGPLQTDGNCFHHIIIWAFLCTAIIFLERTNIPCVVHVMDVIAFWHYVLVVISRWRALFNWRGFLNAAIWANGRGVSAYIWRRVRTNTNTDHLLQFMGWRWPSRIVDRSIIDANLWKFIRSSWLTSRHLPRCILQQICNSSKWCWKDRQLMILIKRRKEKNM